MSAVGDARKRARQTDDLDDLSRDALVARVRTAEDEAQGVRNLVYAADLPGLERERDSALAARDAVAAELAALREGAAALADVWKGWADAPIDNGPGFAARPIYRDAGRQLRTLLDQTRGESDE